VRPETDVELGLAAMGFDGLRLQKLCWSVAHDYTRRTHSSLDSRIEDLVQHLAYEGCRAALRYDPGRMKPNYTAASWLYDILAKRCYDWQRKKAEGFIDKRYFKENPTVLYGDVADVYGPAGGDPTVDEVLANEAAAERLAA
jgi:DNA-directed RNA polymerase specialized sigma24 family protein